DGTLAVDSSECRGEDKVMQPPEDVVAAEGDTVTLDCTFQTTDTNLYLFWYKQDGTSRPQFILSKFTIEKNSCVVSSGCEFFWGTTGLKSRSSHFHHSLT
uniref:Ig-like domain-containing protein n=1 Tax=Takifugu rubripes TaxID=31033 RepID=A0A674NJC8_TAKRU